MAQRLPARSSLPYKSVAGQNVMVDAYPPKLIQEVDQLAAEAKEAIIQVPAVIYFHAGGLTVGNRESWFPFWLYRRTVVSGFAFLCPDYQLLPPATGHDILSDIRDFLVFLQSDAAVFTAPECEFSYRIDPNGLVLAGSSAGGLCAYIAAANDLKPKPKALLSLYGMGGDFMTPYWMEPKQEMFIPGREILDPGNFEEFIHPFSLPMTPNSGLRYHPASHPTPGLPANPRMYLARLYCQLGTFLDYYTGEYNPSLSEAVRRRRREVCSGDVVQLKTEAWAGPLIPRHHLRLFPQLAVNSDWPEVFMIHGTDDYQVPFDESHHLKELLEKAGVKVTLKAVDGKGHSFDYNPNAEEEHKSLFDEVGNFLECMLGKQN